jgi:hypothetical protein
MLGLTFLPACLSIGAAVGTPGMPFRPLATQQCYVRLSAACPS